MIKKSAQTITGKSFEYALLIQIEERLKDKTNLEVIKNSSFIIAKECFYETTLAAQSDYILAASFAINFLIDIEPRLSNGISKDDILQLEILSDHHGKSGDVRDVLIIRALQKWEIGVSAKNNHKAVKHSRLSSDIDFGAKWIGIKSSKQYFDEITPIFNNLRKIREFNKETKWSELGNYHTSVYKPILDSFIKELKRIDSLSPETTATNLVKYLVGNKDFYKVLKTKNKIEIYAYNINGGLNLAFGNIKPKFITPLITLPKKILSIQFKENSHNTIIVTFDNNWVLSFRIHNASSRVEPSLKFDINLLDSPKSLFKNTFNIIQTI